MPPGASLCCPKMPPTFRRLAGGGSRRLTPPIRHRSSLRPWRGDGVSSYRPHRPRVLVTEPQSGKRHADRRVSTSRNAPRRHRAREPSVPFQEHLSFGAFCHCRPSPFARYVGQSALRFPRRLLLAHSSTAWQRHLPGLLASVRFASQNRLIIAEQRNDAMGQHRTSPRTRGATVKSRRHGQA